MQIFNFVVLSVIISLHNVPIPHISKTHLPTVLLNVREIELKCCPNEQSRKKTTPMCGEQKPLFIEVCVL